MNSKIKYIISGSGLMAAAYFLSRILGLVREKAIAYYFGAEGLTDVYNASFTIPEALNYMLAGGAFSIVLIPMISKYLTDTKPPQFDKQGQHIFSAIFTPIVIIISFLTLIAIILTPWISAVVFPDIAKNPVKFDMLVKLTRIILPAQIFFMAGGLINATLRARGDFKGNAWGPNIYNLGIIFGALFLGRFMGISGVSLGVLAGAFVGPFLICYLLAGKTIQYTLSFDFRSPELKEYIKLTLPLMIGVSLLTVDQIFIRYFGARSGIIEGTITCITYGRNIMMVPIALVGQAVGQVSLTYLTHLWQQGKINEFSLTFNQTIRGVTYLSFIMAGGLFLLAHPIISLIFVGGKFTFQNSHYTAELLRYFIFAVPPFAALQILMNGYYSKKNTLRPMIVSSVCTIISAGVYYTLSTQFKGTGIALATLICFWLIFLATLADYYFKYGRKENFLFSSFLVTTLKAVAATAFGLAIAIVLFEKPGFIHLNPDARLSALLRIIFSGSIYTVFVFIVAYFMGGEEANTLKRIFKKVFRWI